MRCIICGKGGSGKSVITSLLAKEISSRGLNVVVVDNDESNFGLHSYLGVDLPGKLMDYFGGRKELFDRVEEMEQFKVDSLPSKFVSENNGIKLLAMGKIEDYGEGCACPINVLTSKFLKNLDLNENVFLLIDSEAGIEHFGRKVEDACDSVLVVVDPTQESLRLAEKILGFESIVEKGVFFVLNKVDKESEDFLLKSLPKERVIATVYDNRDIFKAGMRGREVDGKYRGIEKLADFLLGI